jgi:hypothetical protein
MLKRILGWIWASPVTAIGLLYVLVFWALRWYVWVGLHPDALVWQLDSEKAPGWLKDAWSTWGGHCIGNVVVLKDNPDFNPIVLRHEREHALQCMRLGVLQPIIYAIALLAAKTLDNVDPYRSNVFEIDARIAAGQPVEPLSKKR